MILQAVVLAIAGAGPAAAFVPFAGVEELTPRRLHAFCEDAREEGAGGLRRCSHRFQRSLEDGGDVRMEWAMQVDPDMILSLDTEAEHGVRLAECSPWELRLELPESHAGHAVAGKFVVASRFAHGCGHLEHRPLYHRIKEVKRHEWRDGDVATLRFAHVHLSTEELPSLAHVAPSISFSFAYTPMEAANVVAFPEMRTDFGASRHHVDRYRRRLMDLEEFGEGMRRNLQDHLEKAREAAKDQLGEGGAGFQSGSMTSRSFENGGMNMAPKKVSNFGWNWDFGMNTTEEPEFTLKAPGAKGLVKIRDPYIKAHTGIYLNFSSEFKGLTEPPRVRWTAGMNGHGRMQARILSMMNTTDATLADDDFGTQIDLPFLEKFHNDKWFDKIDIAAGSMPVSFEPGMRFNSKMYHKGAYDGAIALGGRTHGTIHPSMTFDSETGLDTHFEGELLDTDLWPPMWMMFTRKFELGLMAEPTMLMRGDFAGVEKATLALEMRPFLNVTVRRESEKDVKLLTVYPTRAMGLASGDLGLSYKLVLSANGQLLETRPRISWGEVSFRDRISDFIVGNVSKHDLSDQVIAVMLVRVESAESDEELPMETTIGSGSVQCDSAALENGVCEVMARIQSEGGEDVAAVEVVVLWGNTPATWLASRVRGAAVSFPALVVDDGAMLAEHLESNASHTYTQPLSLRLVQGGLSYAVNVTERAEGSFRASEALEFGPGFTGAWSPCARGAPSLCESPRVELYRGTRKVASGELPGMDNRSGHGEPTTVLLRASGVNAPAVAALKVQVDARPPAASSMVLEPVAADQVAIGGVQEVLWTVAGVDNSRVYKFWVKAMRLKKGHSAKTMQPVVVSGRDLEPIPLEFWTVQAACEQRPVAGMPAEKAPCTFSHSFKVRNQSFSAGDIISVQIEWDEEDGQSRVLQSPPVQVSATTSRRLGAMETFAKNLRSLQDLSHSLFNTENWQKKVAENQESCDKRDLHFTLGSGMMGRAKLEDFQLGSGSAQQPQQPFPGAIATPWQRIAKIDRGTDGKDVLPDALCADGLCSGALPGCSQQGFKKNYPRVTFNFNRPLHYNKSNTATMEVVLQQVMAYAFSALPQGIGIAVRELNKSDVGSSLGNGLFGSDPTTTTQTATALSTSSEQPVATKEADWWGPQSAKGDDAGVSDAVPAPELPALRGAHSDEAEDTTGTRHWWPWGGLTERRLRDHSAPQAEEELVSAQGHQVAVEFLDGLPYEVDEALLERMLRHGYFMDVEDGARSSHGPLTITGFHLENREEAAPETPAAGSNAASIAATVAVVVGAALTVSWFVGIAMKRWRLTYTHQAQEDDSSPMAVE